MPLGGDPRDVAGTAVPSQSQVKSTEPKEDGAAAVESCGVTSDGARNGAAPSPWVDGPLPRALVDLT